MRALQILGQGHPCTAAAVRLMWAWGGPALGRGLLEAHGLGFHEPWLDVLHPGPHPISGHASLDEPDAAFVTPDPTAPGDQPVDRNQSFVANGEARSRAMAATPTTGPRARVMNAPSHPKRATSGGTAHKVPSVRKKPRHVCMVSAVPT